MKTLYSLFIAFVTIILLCLGSVNGWIATAVGVLACAFISPLLDIQEALKKLTKE